MQNFDIQKDKCLSRDERKIIHNKKKKKETKLQLL